MLSYTVLYILYSFSGGNYTETVLAETKNRKCESVVATIIRVRSWSYSHVVVILEALYDLTKLTNYASCHGRGT